MSKSLEEISNKQGLFFRIKEESVVQIVLINTLLTKYNCYVDDIAKMIQSNVQKVERVLLGQETLSEQESCDLVSVFYLANSQ